MKARPSRPLRPESEKEKKATSLSRLTGLIALHSLIALLALTAFITPASALQTSGSVTLTVTVQGSFYLMVDSDSFDFANLLPGQTGEISRADGITVSGASTNGNPWYLTVSTEKPLLSGSDSIPNEQFTWYGTSEGQGEWYGSKERTFAEHTSTAYISSIKEADSGSKIANKFKFRLHVPEETKPGVYTTTVMFTMTE